MQLTFFADPEMKPKKKKKVYVAMLFFLADLTTLGTIPNTEYCHVNQPEPVPGDTSGEVG